jgi:hypothetical protein
LDKKAWRKFGAFSEFHQILLQVARCPAANMNFPRNLFNRKQTEAYNTVVNREVNNRWIQKVGWKMQ